MRWYGVPGGAVGALVFAWRCPGDADLGTVAAGMEVLDVNGERLAPGWWVRSASAGDRHSRHGRWRCPDRQPLPVWRCRLAKARPMHWRFRLGCDAAAVASARPGCARGRRRSQGRAGRWRSIPMASRRAARWRFWQRMESRRRGVLVGSSGTTMAGSLGWRTGCASGRSFANTMVAWPVRLPAACYCGSGERRP